MRQLLQLKKAGQPTEALEERIDEMVFDLYALTPDERGIVAGGAGGVVTD